MLHELRVAREWQVPPTHLRREWSLEDRALAMALLGHEDSIGPCGHSHAVTVSDTGENDGHYEVVTDGPACPACAVLDNWRKQNSGDDGMPGQIVRVIDLRDHPDRMS